jgi:hypothetical protein
VDEEGEVNDRLQRYLSNGPDGQALRFDPIQALHATVDEWKRHAADDRLFVCARRRVHLPHCLTATKAVNEATCDCDSDEALSVRSVRVEIHSNCRASIELLLRNEGSDAPGPGQFPETARLFALTAQNNSTPNGGGFEREMPMADIDPFPQAFVWAGLVVRRPKRTAGAKHANKKPLASSKPKGVDVQQPTARPSHPKRVNFVLPPKQEKAPGFKQKPALSEAAPSGGQKSEGKSAKHPIQPRSGSSSSSNNSCGGGGGGGDGDADEFHGRVRLRGVSFDLLEPPRVSEAALSLQLDYMSFQQLSKEGIAF